MTMSFDVVCFGYLSFARILKATSFPIQNSISQLSNIVPTLAADAPIVALFLAQFGLISGLISNPIGNDDDGCQLAKLLNHKNFLSSIDKDEDFTTPQMFIINDACGNRTVMTYMPDVVNQLTTTDLGQIEKSSLAYIDFYSEISNASLRAIHFSSERGKSIFVNMSGFDIEKKITALRGLKGIKIIQISCSKDDDPIVRAYNTLRDIDTEVVLITLGSRGAFGMNRSTSYEMPAFGIQNSQIFHGAGAAFSAGYSYAYLNNWDLKRSLEFACAFAGMTRENPDGLGSYSADEVISYIQQHK